MSELVAIGYPDATTAERALQALSRLEVEGGLELEDAVVVERRNDGRVVLRPGIELAGLEVAGSALLGGVIGTLFFAPLLGAAIGAAAGATRAALEDLGISDDFLRQLGASLPPGSAALMLLASASAPDKVATVLKDFGGHVIQTSLSAEGERALQARLNRA